jgi:hypothetical protein
MMTMVTLEKMLPSRKHHDVAIEKGFSRLLWLTLSLKVCLNKPRKTESEVLILQKFFYLSPIVQVPHWTSALNKISLWTSFSEIPLSHSLS